MISGNRFFRPKDLKTPLISDKQVDNISKIIIRILKNKDKN